MAIKKQKKRGKSPYDKYKKTPYKYSQILQDWTKAVKEGKSNEAAHLARSHNNYVRQLNHWHRMPSEEPNYSLRGEDWRYSDGYVPSSNTARP